MKRRLFLLAIIASIAQFPENALGASKKPSPKAKPSVKRKPSPLPSALPKQSTVISAEYPVQINGEVIKIADLSAPLSLYGSVTAGNREYPLLIAKPNDRTLKVFTARCPHQGNILNLAAKGEFSCDAHGARFEEATGKVLAGPTINNLESYEVIDREGFLYVKITL